MENYITPLDRLALWNTARDGKIPAIKELRALVLERAKLDDEENSGMCLKDAKTYIEDLMMQPYEELVAATMTDEDKEICLFFDDESYQQEMLKRASELSLAQARVALIVILKGIAVEEALDIGKYV